MRLLTNFTTGFPYEVIQIHFHGYKLPTVFGYSVRFDIQNYKPPNSFDLVSKDRNSR